MMYNIPQERIIEIFGHGRPNKHEIDAYKDMMWKHSLRYRRDIKRTIIPHRVHGFLDDIGFYSIVDYQIRERQVRFVKEEILAHALLAGFDEYIVIPPTGELDIWSKI